MYTQPLPSSPVPQGDRLSDFPPVLVALVLLCIASLFTVVACSDSDGGGVSARTWSNAEILAVTPLGVSWAFAVDLEYPGSEDLANNIEAFFSSQPDRDPLFNRLDALLMKAGAGLNPAKDFSNFTLSYLLTPEPSVLLLGDSYNNSLDHLFGGGTLSYQQQHRGVSLYRHSSNNVVAMLPGALLSIGSTSTIILAIDRYYDASSNLESDLLETLATEIEQGPVAFAMALAEDPSIDQQPEDVPSLNTAETLSGALNLTSGQLTGSARFEMRGADIFAARFNALSGNNNAHKVAAPDPEVLEIDFSVNIKERIDRFLLKQLSFGMDGITYAEHSGVGRNFPWLTFRVRNDPGSIFINYRFASEQKRQAFEKKLLPTGFKLAPLPILENEAPQYYLVLNIYGSTGGLVEGARAEWSVFVEDPRSGEPRFLVIEAVAASLAADPVNLLTFPEPVTHKLEDGRVQSYVGRKNAEGIEASYFQSSFTMPQNSDSAQQLALEFVVANDNIFWGNGVADRGLYNSSVHARDVALIDADDFQYQDNSEWSQYLAPKPQHVLSYMNELELIISPWANLEADYLDVTKSHLRDLITFSNNFYPLTATAQAIGAFNGANDATLPQMEASTLPSVYFHFPIIDVQGMTAALSTAGVQQLAALSPSESIPPQHYLTLQVYHYDDDSCGIRADWLTYVVAAETGLAESLYLERLSNEACIDVETLFRPAAQVQHSVSAGRSYLTVNGLNTRFSASADPALAAGIVVDSNWVSAQDEQCSLSGFCDRYFYNGGTLIAALDKVDTSAFDVTKLVTPWDAFISPQPEAVIFRDSSRQLLTLPWSNVNSIDAKSDTNNTEEE